MTDVNIRTNAVLGRVISPTDVILGFDPTKEEASEAAKTDRVYEFFKTLTGSLERWSPEERQQLLRAIQPRVYGDIVTNISVPFSGHITTDANQPGIDQTWEAVSDGTLDGFISVGALTRDEGTFSGMVTPKLKVQPPPYILGIDIVAYHTANILSFRRIFWPPELLHERDTGIEIPIALDKARSDSAIISVSIERDFPTYSYVAAIKSFDSDTIALSDHPGRSKTFFTAADFMATSDSPGIRYTRTGQGNVAFPEVTNAANAPLGTRWALALWVNFVLAPSVNAQVVYRDRNRNALYVYADTLNRYRLTVNNVDGMVYVIDPSLGAGYFNESFAEKPYWLWFGDYAYSDFDIYISGTEGDNPLGGSFPHIGIRPVGLFSV